MAKFTLGLDIGTNSIGWALIENNEKIIDKGVVIFPMGTNLIKGVLEQTKNSERRGYRSAARNHFRYKLRRKELREVLSNLKMLPKPGITFTANELYSFRKKALDEIIELEELGRIFLLINKHRGFKSNSKTLSLSENSDEEEGKVKDGITELKKSVKINNARTVGEYFYKMYEKSDELFNEGKWHNADEPFDERAENSEGQHFLFNNRGIRRENGRYVGREMYEDEFDMIWEKQRELHLQKDFKKYSEIYTGSKEAYENIRNRTDIELDEKRKLKNDFKLTNYWKIRNYSIFYQRPLKSPKKFIAKCEFEKNKRTAPISSLQFQEFRIWKQLADLKITDSHNDVYNQALSFEQKKTLFNILNFEPSLGTKRLKAELKLSSSSKLNFDNEDNDKSFIGNRTLVLLSKACGEDFIKKLLMNDKVKLEKLWHVIYMSKDTEWLKETLSDKSKWNFDDNISEKLCNIQLEEGYASFSTKVMNKLLPFMREGKSEYDALVFANYKKDIDEVKDELPSLKKFISQLKNNELRNPIVEKAVSQAIKLINSIVKKYSHGNPDFAISTIRIESTREFKKPKKQREEMRRSNTETDKKREQYAKFLINATSTNGQPLFKSMIHKNSSIIHKFELWLELGEESNDLKEFKKFLSDSKDLVLSKEKLRLWLEQGFICPYTNVPIPFSKLNSAEIEIEHIIPLSRSLDNSFTNKTLCYRTANVEKGNLTAYEYMDRKGTSILKDYKKRITSLFDKSSTKKDNFLNDNYKREFDPNQINNASYIATEVHDKLLEICRDIQFTNGSATAELRKYDWNLNMLLDKIKYEEEVGIDIDSLRYSENYKELWQAFSEWRKQFGDKKNRTDHRHHVLDAIITGCTSRSIIKQLSTFNRLREESGMSQFDEKGKPNRDEIECPLSNYYMQIKDALKNVLVVHISNQRLLVSKKNKYKTSKGFYEQRTKSVRGSLVGDNFYGKLKEPQKQKIERKNVYVKRVAITSDNFKNEVSVKEKVYDEKVQQILLNRLAKYGGSAEKAFSEQAMVHDPIYMYSINKYPDGLPDKPLSKIGNPLPVLKKIRILNKNSRNLVHLPEKNEAKEILNDNRYAEADGNYIMALYERKNYDTQGNLKKSTRDFKLVPFYKAVQNKLNGENLFSDEKEQKDGTFIPLMEDCPYLRQGDIVVMYENENDKKLIDWNDNEDLKRRLYVVKGLDSKVPNKKYPSLFYGYVSLAKHNITGKNVTYESLKFSLNNQKHFLYNSHVQLNATKVQINNLGEITKHNQ